MNCKYEDNMQTMQVLNGDSSMLKKKLSSLKSLLSYYLRSQMSLSPSGPYPSWFYGAVERA